MRKLVNLLLASLFLMALFGAGPALAASEEPVPEGQLVKSYIDVAYFQTWMHSNGTWQDTDHDGTKDQPGQTKDWSYEVKGVLEPLALQYDITGVRVRYLSNDDWNGSLYQQAGGYAGWDFNDFDLNILRYTSAEGNEGKVWAEENGLDYTLHYEGIRLATRAGVSDTEKAKNWAMDLKRDDMQAILSTLGIPLQVPAGGISKMAEGWNYWLPYIVEIYGTPKEKPKAPNFSVELDPGCPQVNGEYTAVPGQKYTALVKFRVDKPVKNQTAWPPFDVVVAGLHQVGSTWWPASLDYIAGPGSIEQENGLEPWIPIIPADVQIHLLTFNTENTEVVGTFEWTANRDTQALAADINLGYPEDNPLPYTLTFYAEGEAGNLYADNVQVVPIKVIVPDMYTRISTGATETNPGQAYTGTVTYGLKDDFPYPVKATLLMANNGYSVTASDGTPLNDQTPVEFQPGEEKTYSFTWHGVEGGNTLVAKIHPVNPPDDKNWNDNKDEKFVPMAAQCTDVSVDLSSPVSQMETGMNIPLFVTIKRDNEGPTGPVRVRLTLSGGISETETLSLARGQSKKLGWDMTINESGLYTFHATVSLLDGVEDCYPGNNSDSHTVNVEECLEPQAGDEIKVSITGTGR